MKTLATKSNTAYSKAVAAKMKFIRLYIKKHFGEENVHEVTLEVLADNLQLIEQCREEISKNGLITTAANGYLQRNPVVDTLRQAQSMVVKICGEFGLTAKAMTKIKGNDADDDSDDLQALING